MARRPQSRSERRASVRVPYPVRAVLSTRLGEVAAEVVDLSVGGLGVEVARELRACEFVRVLFPLAVDERTSEWVDPDALIARVHSLPRSGRSRVGLSFFELPPQIFDRIAACVVARLQSMPAAHPPAATTARPPDKTTRELPVATPSPPQPAAANPALELPRTSARELRTLFHEALAALEEDTGGPKKPR